MAKNTIADLDTTAANNTDLLNQSNAGSASANTIDTLFSNLGAILARFYNDLGGVVTVGGTADAITITTTSTYQALESGLVVGFKAGSANTGAATVNVDSLGAKAIRRQGDSALSANDILANGRYLLVYDTAYNGGSGAWILTNPAFSSTAVTAPADPNADRFLGWDDSAGSHVYFAPNANLVFSGTDVRVYEVWGGNLSDETTAITTGTAKLSFSIPYAFEVVGVYATLNTASTSGTPTFDINEAGTTILSTKIVIDANEYTGGSSGYQGTAAAAAVISDTSIAANAQITMDIDVAGTGAKGAKCFMIGYRSA